MIGILVSEKIIYDKNVRMRRTGNACYMEQQRVAEYADDKRGSKLSLQACMETTDCINIPSVFGLKRVSCRNEKREIYLLYSDNFPGRVPPRGDQGDDYFSIGWGCGEGEGRFWEGVA